MEQKTGSILDNDLKTSKRKRNRISTYYFELLPEQDINSLANQLTYVANNPTKYGIFELTKNVTFDTTPFLIVRIQEDLDMPDKEAKIKVKAHLYTAETLSDLDEVINNGIKPNSGTELLGEFRYVHKEFGLCIMLIWAEAEQGSRQIMEGLHAIRTLCKNIR